MSAEEGLMMRSKAISLCLLGALSAGICACGSLTGTKTVKASLEPVTAAIIPFENDPTGAAAEIFQTEALKLPYQIIERSRIEALLKEQSMGQSGALSADSAAKIGGLLGVKKIITGRVIEWRDATFKILPPAFSSLSVKCIDVQTGQLDWTAQSEWRWDGWAWAGTYITWGISALWAEDGQGAMKATARKIVAELASR